MERVGSCGRAYCRSAAAAFVVAGCLSMCGGCIWPSPLAEVDAPRLGRAIGGRVAVVYSRRYQIDLGGFEKLHSFDIHKYERIYLALVRAGDVRAQEVFVPAEATTQQILRVHTPEYLATLGDPAAVGRYLEAPQVKALPAKAIDAGILRAFRYATGGTVLAARLALRYGVAVNLAGGYHHAKPDAGEGFCIYNDIAVAIRAMQDEGLSKRALVVDLDVHQGNGTAVCFAGDKRVFTFSMHEGGIYPVPKARSDLDVELSAGTDDEEYMRLLASTLQAIIEKFRPDLVILQAGCDTLAGDPLAHLEMTPAGIVRRDALVIDECVRRRIPVVMTLGGGYSRGAWRAQYASIRRTLETHGQAVPARQGKRGGKARKLVIR